MSQKNACEGVFAVFGASYSGTTLLSLLLDNHSQIVGGGELHLVASGQEREGVCAFCRGACRYWTPSVRKEAAISNIYHLTSGIFNKPYVVDTSKMQEWFDRALPHYSAVSVFRILMSKHPYRLVSSFLEKSKYVGHLSQYDDLETILRHLAIFYNTCFIQNRFAMHLKYEDLVTEPAKMLKKLLALCDIEYEDAMLSWQHPRHHGIGGNVGVRYQIQGDAILGPTHLRQSAAYVQSSMFLKKYSTRGLFVDDTYQEILTEDDIKTILNDDNGKRLFDMLEYPTDIDGDTECRSMSAGTGSIKEIELAGGFEAEMGACYIFRLSASREAANLERVADSAQWPLRSPVILLENDRPLGPAHAPHAVIRQQGKGVFSHWGEAIYLSTSDNSDPNTNGRRYAVMFEEPASAPMIPNRSTKALEIPATTDPEMSGSLAAKATNPTRSLFSLHGFAADGGNCFTVKLPETPGDTEQQPHRSSLRLIEDGVELGPPHTTHRDIRELGCGRYSHWGDTIYFATADNSDPRTNGRTYHAYVAGGGGQSATISQAIEVLRALAPGYGRDEAYAAVEGALKALDPQVALPDPNKIMWENETFARDYRRICGTDRRAMERKYTVYRMVQALAAIPGELAECGTRNGETAYFMALAGRHAGNDRPLHVFDSFEGLSEPGEFDGSFWIAGGLAAPESNVRRNLAEFNCLVVHRGWIPSRFDAVAEKRFCFVHIDVDLYEPTRASLEFFYPRLEPGGILLCDDYGSALCPGARKAMDEFFHDQVENIIDLSTMQGLIIKR